jgi:hypothetical protein
MSGGLQAEEEPFEDEPVTLDPMAEPEEDKPPQVGPRPVGPDHKGVCAAHTQNRFLAAAIHQSNTCQHCIA